MNFSIIDQCREGDLYARIREISIRDGVRLRISIAPHPAGAMVTLEHAGHPLRPSVVLSLYGAEILGGFIMSARLCAPHPMPDEAVGGPFPARFRLECGPPLAVTIEQEEGSSFPIGELLWDRLYAELCLVTAHGRELARGPEASLH